jgi:hypothetical protein
MNQNKAIFRSKCSALTPKNNEILVYILPFKSAYYLFLIPKLLFFPQLFIQAIELPKIAMYNKYANKGANIESPIILKYQLGTRLGSIHSEMSEITMIAVAIQPKMKDIMKPK